MDLRGFLKGLWKCSVWYHQDEYMSSCICPNPMECTTRRLNPKINHGLWVIKVCQFNVGSFTVTKVSLWWGPVIMGRLCMCEGRGLWEIFVSSSWFCCEPKTFRKNKSLEKLGGRGSRFNSNHNKRALITAGRIWPVSWEVVWRPCCFTTMEHWGAWWWLGGERALAFLLKRVVPKEP